MSYFVFEILKQRIFSKGKKEERGEGTNITATSENNQSLSHPDGMSALTFLYLECLICLLLPILFQTKNSNEMSLSTLLYWKYLFS